jgi:hypothetical protein
MKSIKKKMSFFFPLKNEWVTTLLTFGGLMALVAAVFYGEPSLKNPFFVVWVYLTLNVFLRTLTSNFDGSSDADMWRGFVFGPLNLTTGIILISTHLPMNNLLDCLAASSSIWFLIDGAIQLLLSSLLLHIKYMERVQMLVELNERARMEQEIARKWEAQEAERKQTATVEAQLFSDLTEFLDSSVPDPEKET